MDDGPLLSWNQGFAKPCRQCDERDFAPNTDLVYCQRKRCLTYARHLAEQFALICELPGGIYHVASQNDRSTYESARFIAETIGASADEIESYIVPNYDRYADRFRDYRLNADKLSQYGIVFGTFEEDVLQILTDFNWRKNDLKRISRTRIYKGFQLFRIDHPCFQRLL